VVQAVAASGQGSLRRNSQAAWHKIVTIFKLVSALLALHRKSYPCHIMKKEHTGEKFRTRRYTLWVLLTVVVALAAAGRITAEIMQGSSFQSLLSNYLLIGAVCISVAF